MIKKQENEVMGKRPYVSIWLEMISLTNIDIVTTSKDSQDSNDITQDDIFD